MLACCLCDEEVHFVTRSCNGDDDDIRQQGDSPALSAARRCATVMMVITSANIRANGFAITVRISYGHTREEGSQVVNYGSDIN